MQVNNVSKTNFQGQVNKKYILIPAAQQNIKKLLWEMNHSTVYRENAAKTSWISKILAAVSIGDNIKFSDLRNYKRPIDNPQEFKYDCSLSIGSTLLYINSSSGEIVHAKKSFFKPWKKVLKDTKHCLQTFIDNFNNPNIVTKNSFEIGGYTPKGAKERMERFFK